MTDAKAEPVPSKKEVVALHRSDIETLTLKTVKTIGLLHALSTSTLTGKWRDKADAVAASLREVEQRLRDSTQRTHHLLGGIKPSQPQPPPPPRPPAYKTSVLPQKRPREKKPTAPRYKPKSTPMGVSR